MREVARAFAVLSLAIASRGQQAGLIELGAVEQQQFIDDANRAQFEHLVLSGASVDAVRSANGASWCGVVVLGGMTVTMCDMQPATGRPMKSRRVTCPRCRGALGAPLVELVTPLAAVA